MLSRGWLLFATVALFFLGLLATVDFLQAFFTDSHVEDRMKSFMRLTTCFYFSYLHLHIWWIQERTRELEKK